MQVAAPSSDLPVVALIAFWIAELKFASSWKQISSPLTREISCLPLLREKNAHSAFGARIPPKLGGGSLVFLNFNFEGSTRADWNTEYVYYMFIRVSKYDLLPEEEVDDEARASSLMSQFFTTTSVKTSSLRRKKIQPRTLATRKSQIKVHPPSTLHTGRRAVQKSDVNTFPHDR
jgi:hypothetical protein